MFKYLIINLLFRYGKLGNKTRLKVNFFEIKLSQSTPNYFHYNIEILKSDSDTPSSSKGRKGGKQQPKKDSTPKSKKTPKRLNDEIFRQVFKNYNSIFQCSILPVFDGEKNFYSLNQFNLPNGGNWSGEVTVKDKDKDEKFLVNITTPEISHGQNLRTLKQNDGKVMPVELQALDIIMRNGPRLCKISLGSNFFFKSNDPKSREYQFDIGSDFIKYGQFGVYQNAKKAENNRLFYNVDRAMAVFTEGGPLINFVNKTKNDNELEHLIKGLKFTALHLNYKRTFIIAGLSKETVKNQKFNYEENNQKKSITVLEYFKKEYSSFYNRYKFDERLPCVQVGSRNNAKYFPIECCELEYDEVYRRKLEPMLQGMVTRKSSQQTPIDRFKGIERNIQSIRDDNTIVYNNRKIDYLREFGIQISDRATEIDARILSAPKIEYNNLKEADSRGQGQWDMKGKVK